MPKRRPDLEPEVVLAEDLANFLQKLIDAEMDGYAAATGNPREQCGIITRLAQQAGVPERRIHGILYGEQCFVDLDLADRLLLAFDRFIELELPDSIVPEYDARVAAFTQTEMMRTWARARGRTWPTTRQGKRTEPLKIRKEVWREERAASSAA